MFVVGHSVCQMHITMKLVMTEILHVFLFECGSVAIRPSLTDRSPIVKRTLAQRCTQRALWMMSDVGVIAHPSLQNVPATLHTPWTVVDERHLSTCTEAHTQFQTFVQ